MKNVLINLDKGLNSFILHSWQERAAKLGHLSLSCCSKALHWNPRQRRKKEKAIRIFGDFLYCALCTTSLWTEMKNQRWKLFGIEILLQNIILAHHLASFWILRRFQIWPKLTPMGCLHQGEIKRRSLTWYTAHSLCTPFMKVGPY